MASNPRSISFIGRQSGDCECFCWDGVPIDQRKSIVGQVVHAMDVQMGDPMDRIYPDDIMRKLRVGCKKKYKITITVEPL